MRRGFHGVSAHDYPIVRAWVRAGRYIGWVDQRTVGELGERRVLARVLAQLGQAQAAVLGPGDDCAVLQVSGDAVVSSDTMIEGVDFRLDWHGGFELGWKLAATNLSDVAAMGARPTALTASLACPRDTPVGLIEAIAQGLDAACRELAPGCGVVGGDLGAAPVLVAAITALGDLDGRPPVTRAGAIPGDRLAYAGQLGLAGLGLSHLTDLGVDQPGLTDPAVLSALRATYPAAVGAQLAPYPPIRLGVSAAFAGVHAMLDVSDGLSLDAARMAEASGVTLHLNGMQLEAAFGEQDGEAVPRDQMLTGGEDHGLLAAFPAGAPLPEGFHEIGSVAERTDGSVLVTLDGVPYEPRGWDPYARHSADS